MNCHPLPVLIDLSDKTVLLLSGKDAGDPVTAKLGRALSSCTPRLKVLSPAPSPLLIQVSEENQISLEVKDYDRNDLYGADVVFGIGLAPAVMDDVYAACHTLGIRLCMLSQPSRSDFTLQEGF